jgi:hypothetical protein
LSGSKLSRLNRQNLNAVFRQSVLILLCVAQITRRENPGNPIAAYAVVIVCVSEFRLLTIWITRPLCKFPSKARSQMQSLTVKSPDPIRRSTSSNAMETKCPASLLRSAMATEGGWRSGQSGESGGVTNGENAESVVILLTRQEDHQHGGEAYNGECCGGIRQGRRFSRVV